MKRLAFQNESPDFKLPLSKSLSDTEGWQLLYRTVPNREIAVTDFERLAIARQDLLRRLEVLKTEGHPADEESVLVRQMINDNELLSDASNDNVSHYILRIAYCRSDMQRRWLLQFESLLLRYRLESHEHVLAQLMEKNRFDGFQQVTEDEYRRYQTQLRTVEQLDVSSRSDLGMETVYFKIPFDRVLDLVQSRRVFLHQGFAFVALKKITSLLIGQFRAELSRALVATYNSIDAIRNSERLRLWPLFDKMNELYARTSGQRGAAGSAVASGQVKPEQIEELSASSFPLCMKNLHSQLKREHHLKHGGRMQYGLFLKGIGLSLEDALRFWKELFGPKVGYDRFDKEYAYNIRHNYGKEGKRADYTPFSCMKIIKSQPGVGDSHGCCFRHFDESGLRRLLVQSGLSSTDEISEVLDLVKNNHYQVACGRLFELTHPGSRLDSRMITHPNSYFEESQKFHRLKQGGGATSTPAASKTNP